MLPLTLGQLIPQEGIYTPPGFLDLRFYPWALSSSLSALGFCIERPSLQLSTFNFLK